MAALHAPVSDPALKHYLKSVVLGAYLRDNVKGRVLQPDGLYVPVLDAGEKPFISQTSFIDENNVPAN